MADETIPLAGSEGASPKPESAPVTETTAPTTPEAAPDGQPAPETGEAAAPAAETTAEGTAAKERQKRSVKDRIDALTRQKRDAQREAATATEREQKLRERLKQYETSTPDPLAYDTDAAYQAALSAHHLDKRLKQERESDIEDVRAAAQTHNQTAQSAAQAAFDARADIFAERAPDFREAISDPTLPVTDAMAEMIRGADEGPAIAYYLAKNRQDAARIAQLTNPMDVAREIGTIQGRISRPAPKTVTSAPAPMGAVATGSGGMDEPSVAQQVRKALYADRYKKGA